MANPVDLARLAGYVDSEGCLRIKTWRRKDKPVVFRAALYVVNCEHELVYWIKERFGGTITVRKPKSKQHRTSYAWELSSASLQRLLPAICKFLVSKRKQAEITASFFQTVSKEWPKGKDLPGTVKEHREALIRFLGAATRERPSPRFPVPVSVEPSMNDYAYMAGLIDGDGSILMNRAKKRRAASLRVLLTTCDGRLVDWCLERFGGGVISYQPHNYRWSKQYKWNTSHRGAKKLLLACFPHFLIKKGQAEDGLRFFETVGVPGSRLSLEAKLERHKILQSMYLDRGRNVCQLSQS